MWADGKDNKSTQEQMFTETSRNPCLHITLLLNFYPECYCYLFPYRAKHESRGDAFSDEFTLIRTWHLINYQLLMKHPTDIRQTVLEFRKKRKDLFWLGRE